MPKPRELHDKYFLQAKAEGYAARSAYKLKQIHERYRVLRPGDTVLDLGCAPGSWMQVASEIIGPHGVIVGIDLLPVNIKLPSNARAIQGDAFKVTPRELLDLTNRGKGWSDGLFSVVLSDMAPNTAGIGDDLRSVTLCRRVLEIAEKALAPGGRLVMKVLEGELYPDLMREALGVFEFARGYRPDATREVSREIFAVCMRFRGSRPDVPKDPKAESAPVAGWADLPAARVPPHKRVLLEKDPRRQSSRRFKPLAKGMPEPEKKEPKRRPFKKKSGPPSKGSS
jgi:23S rRNA (uridine2552-2'-O)-methyltransferase